MWKDWLIIYGFLVKPTLLHGESLQKVSDFIFLDSKIPVDGDCSHEIKRQLLLGRRATTNLDSILKSRHISLTTKVHIVKAIVMCGCENWTIKKAEHQRTDAFNLWCWRRLLRAPWTARRSKHSIPKEINPEYSLAGLVLKLKLQYFGQLMRRANSLAKPWCWESMRAEKVEKKEETEDEMVGWHHWLNGHDFEQTPADSEGQGSLACCSP